MSYLILREDGKLIAWIDDRFVGVVSDAEARLIEAAQQSAQRTCLNCGQPEDNHVGRGHHFVPSPLTANASR